MGSSGSTVRISLHVLFAGVVAWLFCGPSASEAQTRRAFLVGIQHYSDKKVPQLERTINDANDLAKDLEEIGFDKKNIKVVNDTRNKDAFDREFNAFLNTIKVVTRSFSIFQAMASASTRPRPIICCSLI